MASIDEAKFMASLDQSSLTQHETTQYHSLVRHSNALMTAACDRPDAFAELLASIPSTHQPSGVPLEFLSYLLANVGEAPIPVFDLLRCHLRLWHCLPEGAKSGLDHDGFMAATRTLDQVKARVGSLPALLSHNSNSDSPAFIDPLTKTVLSHRLLSRFIRNFTLPITCEEDSKPIVVIALPNGPLLGLAVLAVTSYYTAAPINPAGGAEQFWNDVHLIKSKAILAIAADIDRLGLRDPWIAQAGIQVFILDQEADLTFSVRSLDGSTPSLSQLQQTPPNQADDRALVLFTSGTSGTKKVVPYSLYTMLSGVSCVIDSWGMTPTDSCLNMMPLNHVGGIIRNLFAPVFSGGSTILCVAFDPNLFWDVVEEGNATWYYASPSMHLAILAEGENRPESVSKCHLRLVCNAAGGLLPSLALQLKSCFKGTVLPSYGMTECMPISTPPLDYLLDRTGTSGLGCGPGIAILDEDDELIETGQVGRICVRGGPTFCGYLKGEKIDVSAFTKDGWFDTGDLGYLDQDGFLFLTGRGKEVINRGGEIISPFEVEEAIIAAAGDSNSPLFERISDALTFSAPHAAYQEVVGAVIVTPAGRKRPDLRELQAALKESLHSSKWPMVIVYMDAVPKANNKVLRIRLGERLDMETLTDHTTLSERHFEAICPPVNTGLGVKIPKSPCVIDPQLVSEAIRETLSIALEEHVYFNHHTGLPEVVLAPKAGFSTSQPSDTIIDCLWADLRTRLHGYLVPIHIHFIEQSLPYNTDGTIDSDRLEEILKSSRNVAAPAYSPTEQKVRDAFAEVLSYPSDEISSESDFFELGGDSLSAGKLLSLLRRDFGVRLAVDKLFGASKVCDLTRLVEDKLALNTTQDSTAPAIPLPGCEKTYSSTNPFVLFVNLLPILIVYPLKITLRWIILMYSLSSLLHFWVDNSICARFLSLVTAMAAGRIATQIATPVIAILTKWVVIGRYKEGMYPMWGPYHTRWWFVQKVLQIGGIGMFRHFNSTRVLYYRLLGANIGKGVTIEPGVTLGEYDLLEIGDNVTLDRCTVRPFAVERNTSMYLGKITIGENASVGLKAHVAAGATVPPNRSIGPNGSSYELDDNTDSSAPIVPKPKVHPLLQLCAIIPTQVIVLFLSSLPWMGGLFGIVVNEPTKSSDSVRAIIFWWATRDRIGFHYLAQILNCAVRPFIWFGLVIVIKKAMDVLLGPVYPKAASEKTGGDIFRTSMMAKILPGGNLHPITQMFGSHYEFTSMAARALGAKVGSRVYWPGTGPSVKDYDLLEIGDDVVFGSRSYINNVDSLGSDYVRVDKGAMVADRVILQPGTRLGKRAILGSGAVTTRDTEYPDNTVWIGNVGGKPVCLSGQDNSHPTRKREYKLDEKKSSSKLSLGNWGKKTKVTVREVYKSTPEGTDSDFSKGGEITPYPYSPTSGNTSGNSSDIGEDYKGQVSRRESIQSSSSKEDDDSGAGPFGRAFYEGKADFYVIGSLGIFLYATGIQIFVTVFWNVATFSTVVLARIMHEMAEVFEPFKARPLLIYAIMFVIMSIMTVILSIISIAIVIASKWALLGRRKVGNYDWDKSSYCQRWQIFLNIELIRRKCFSGYGILGMLTGTHFQVLYFRALGAKIGKDCALFAGGHPSLVFTEPDLIEMGDRVAIDDCSVVAHINSRGNFSLNKLKIGSRSVMRSGTRLLSGAQMGEDSCLLEQTLIMAGDVADDRTTYQGWPADIYTKERVRLNQETK